MLKRKKTKFKHCWRFITKIFSICFLFLGFIQKKQSWTLATFFYKLGCFCREKLYNNFKVVFLVSVLSRSILGIFFLGIPLFLFRFKVKQKPFKRAEAVVQRRLKYKDTLCSKNQNLFLFCQFSVAGLFVIWLSILRFVIFSFSLSRSLSLSLCFHWEYQVPVQLCICLNEHSPVFSISILRKLFWFSNCFLQRLKLSKRWEIKGKTKETKRKAKQEEV